MKAKLATVCLGAAALLTAALHWMPLDHPLLGWALGFWLAGLVLSRHAARWPLVAVTLAWLLSCWWSSRLSTQLVVQGVPMLGVALIVLQLSPRAIQRLMLWSCAGAGVLALHALCCFWAFRALGGSHGIRPPLTGWRWLVWPYYETHYDIGAHLVGVFLNDNLFGVWAVAFFALSLVLSRAHPRIRVLLSLGAALLFLAAVWTYSRSAMVAALGVLAYLAVRWSPRILLVVLLVPLLYLAFATWLDRYRFLDPTSEVVYPSWRVEQVRRAARTLASGSPFGVGPGAAGLVDTQWAKIPLELGWLGLLAYGWLAWRTLRGTDVGLKAAILAMWLGGIGTDLFESPHLAATLAFFWGCQEALSRPVQKLCDDSSTG